MSSARGRLSAAEQRYIGGGIEVDVRADGRGRLDCRAFQVETGVVAQANGSARILWDTTDIVVGIKAEIAEPARDTPDHGSLVCTVDCSAIGSQEFEGRGAEELNAELAQALQKVFSQPKVFDTKALCIYPGAQCWNLYLDALVLDFGGNLLDALVLASRAALFDLRLPAVTVNNATGGEPEISISDDPDDVRGFDIRSVPVGITLSRIGRSFIVDATPAEALCADAYVLVCVDASGRISLVQKGGTGSLAAGSLTEVLRVRLARHGDVALAVGIALMASAATWSRFPAVQIGKLLGVSLAKQQDKLLAAAAASASAGTKRNTMFLHDL